MCILADTIVFSCARQAHALDAGEVYPEGTLVRTMRMWFVGPGKVQQLASFIPVAIRKTHGPKSEATAC
jgi:hypothetical protein